MGNSVSYLPKTMMSGNNGTRGKVIMWDGTVHEFKRSATAAELMIEHPQQVVVEFNAAAEMFKRPTPLAADQKLDVKKVYVMVPVRRGKPATLSSEEARRVLLSANSVLRSKSLLSSTSGFLPLFAKMCTVGTGGDHFVLVKKESLVCREEEMVRCSMSSEFLPESLEGRPEYLSRQLSGKGWKPSLDTIKEKKIERKVKVPHWLF